MRNFSISHYAGIRVESGGIEICYILDLVVLRRNPTIPE
jgi:hypothetical protein